MQRIIFHYIFLVAFHSSLLSQQAFPGAEGFGSGSRSAYGGGIPPRILVVNSLQDDPSGDDGTGRGTFRWCVTRDYPRIVLFEVGGTIELDGLLEIRNPYLFVAGQTAPSPGILISNSSIVVRSHDILLQHLSIRPGDIPLGSNPSGRDCISLYSSDCNDITVDHCSLLWGVDENLSIWGDGEPIQNFTISNCIIAQGLHYSIHSDGGHSKGLLVGYNTRNISILKNLFAHNDDRNPLLQGGSTTEVINNVIYNGIGVIQFEDRPSYISKAAVINNIVLKGFDYKDDYVVRIGNINLESEIFLSGNSESSNDWSYTYGNIYESQVKVLEATIQSGRVDILPRNKVNETIVQHAGSRPWERNIADQQVVNSFLDGTGRIIDCVDDQEIRYNSGRVINASKSSLTLDSNASDKRLAYENKSIEIVSGPGSGQRRSISSYSPEEQIVHISPDWIDIPDQNSQYDIIVDCSNNAGGSFQLDSSYKVLTLPDDPHSDSNLDGFTRLEEWIHSFYYIGMDTDLHLKGESTLEVYPNPSTGLVTISLDESIYSRGQVSVSTMSGQKLILKELALHSTEFKMQLDISHLKPGMYLIALQLNKHLESRKLILH